MALSAPCAPGDSWGTSLRVGEQAGTLRVCCARRSGSALRQALHTLAEVKGPAHIRVSEPTTGMPGLPRIQHMMQGLL
jgi:hypothetical protein